MKAKEIIIKKHGTSSFEPMWLTLDIKQIEWLMKEYHKQQLKILNIPVVSGSASDFYTDLMKLINAYCKQGLKKPDLVHKMEYATESCKLS